VVADVERLGQVRGGLAGLALADAARLEHGHPQARLLEQQRGGDAGDPPADDRHVNGGVTVE
jgi:hypothetical protein